MAGQSCWLRSETPSLSEGTLGVLGRVLTSSDLTFEKINVAFEEISVTDTRFLLEW